MKEFEVRASLEEELNNQPLKIQGKIPQWLSGTLVRNGPIDVFVNGKTTDHWFDGLAMLHAFSFQKGEVTYSNKFLRTDAYKKVFEEGSLNYEGFAIDPCRSLFKKFFTFFYPSSCEVLHNANINVGKLADAYVAYTEVPLPVSFDKETLNTLGVFNYQDELPKDKCWESAHPHYDATRKETINYLIEYGRKSYYVVYRILDGSSERQVIARIPVQNPAYMHSFSVTENRIIFTEYPFVVKPFEMVFGSKAFIKNFVWKQNDDTHFLILDRHKGSVVGRYSIKPFFAFHHANAYEKGNKIILDIVTYKDAEIISAIGDQTRENSALNEKVKDYNLHLERFTVDLDKETLVSEPLFDHVVEFPRINQDFDGKIYRYLYLIDPQEGGTRPLYKVDVEKKKSLQWSQEGCQPGEPVFVQSPDSKDEDDGVVLAVVFDSLRKQSFLLVLDGKSFTEIGRAIVTHVIPPGLHGQFF